MEYICTLFLPNVKCACVKCGISHHLVGQILLLCTLTLSHRRRIGGPGGHGPLNQGLSAIAYILPLNLYAVNIVTVYICPPHPPKQECVPMPMHLEDTRAVIRAMAQPRRKEPKKIPMKEPMDSNSEATSNVLPSLYLSTDLHVYQRTQKHQCGAANHSIVPMEDRINNSPKQNEGHCIVQDTLSKHQ